MSWVIFVEEPGVHQVSLPYNVLAAIAVEEHLVWQLSKKLREAEVSFFGAQLEQQSPVFTVEDMLNERQIQIAESHPLLESSLRIRLTKECLVSQAGANSAMHGVALAQTQIAYCRFVLELLRDFQSKALAVFTPSEFSTFTYRDHLRKDYSFMLERALYLLRDQHFISTGILVFDPKRHSDDLVPISAISDYFDKTTKGRLRSRLIVPEPMMANSRLTSINQGAVLLSRILSWSFRLPNMKLPRRRDLDGFVKQCNRLRFSFMSDSGHKEWSFKFIETVRAQHEASSPTM